MNRWVGIVSLREIAPPTPVHRIALAIDAARNRTSYQLAGQTVPYARMRSALRTLGQEHARHREGERYAYCVDLAGEFFDGGHPSDRTEKNWYAEPLGPGNVLLMFFQTPIYE
ncbi:hypothetical protein OHA45_33950 [Streptomyces lydicus]|uniref:hypothetical protein n=1 Tax=Streptomyces lydicus TaxID=47763 RepID=UPI002E2EBDE0|nr:hypothetical protein [Streptomyces lydicus]